MTEKVLSISEKKKNEYAEYNEYNIIYNKIYKE